MVSEAILGAVVGGGAAVAASFVQAWFNRQNTKDRINAENQRYHAEIYAGEKVEALAQLHSKLVESRQVLSKQLGRKADDMTEEEVQKEVLSLVDSLQASLDKCTIFLDKRQVDILSDAYLRISAASEFLEAEAQGEPHRVPDVDSSELIDDTNEAMKVLEKEINKPIEKFESN